MEILLAMIDLPLLAVLLYYFNGQRQHGLDRSARESARKWILVIGVLIWVHAGVFFFWMMTPLFEAITDVDDFLVEDALAFVLRGLMFSFLAFIGWTAFAVSKHEERDELLIYDNAQREREHDRLRVGMFALIGLPLLIPGTFVLLSFSVLAAVGFSFLAITTRARHNRLLWTLALAAKHKLSFVDELNNFAFTERGKRRDELIGLATDLSRGTTLSQALLTGKRLLPFEYAAAIQAAEQTDSLDTVLPKLAIKHTQQLRNFHVDSSLNNIAIYAFFVTALVLQVTGFIMYWIIPKYKRIFEDFGVELPTATTRLISFADYFLNFWFILIPLLILPFLTLFGIAFLSLGPTRWTPKFLYRMFPRLATPQLLRSIGHVAEFSGSIPETVDSLSRFAADQGWSSRFRRVGERIEMGEEIGNSMYGEDLLYHREAQAIDSAQELGHLAWAMDTIADRIDRLRRNRFMTWAEIFKPVIILAVGLLVFFFVYSMFAPLVQLLDDLT